MAGEVEGAGGNRFLVPQYIDTEPKILGPITVRQFILILLGGMFGFVFWKIFENINQNVGIAIIVFQMIIWLIFAFATINGQKFHYFLLNTISTMKKPKLRVWKKKKVTRLPKEDDLKDVEKIFVKPLPQKTRLSDLALLVDTGGAYNVKTENENNIEGVDDMSI